MNKLARAKPLSASEKNTLRTYNWQRVLGHREIVDSILNPKNGKFKHIYNRVGAIYELERPGNIDLHFAKTFLKQVITQPRVSPQGQEKKVDIRMVPYDPHEYGLRRKKNSLPESLAAEIVLREMGKKWPAINGETVVKRQITKAVKQVNRKKVKPTKKWMVKEKVLKNILKGVRRKIAELEPKLLHWERRLGKCSVSNPKLPDTQFKVRELRQEMLRLSNRQAELKARITNGN